MKKAGVYKNLGIKKLPDTMHEIYKKEKKDSTNSFLRFLETKKIIPLLFTILIAAFIFYMSNSSSPVGVEVSFSMAKLYHVGVFFLLSFFFLATIKNGRLKPSYLVIAFLFSFLYATLDELHQFFIPGRHASPVDVMIDTTGILFSILVYSLISGELKK